MSTTSKYITNNNNSTTIVQMSTFDNNNNNNKVEADGIETLHIDDDNKNLPILNDKQAQILIKKSDNFFNLITNPNAEIFIR